jgi:hypothetical protein
MLKNLSGMCQIFKRVQGERHIRSSMNVVQLDTPPIQIMSFQHAIGVLQTFTKKSHGIHCKYFQALHCEISNDSPQQRLCGNVVM